MLHPFELEEADLSLKIEEMVDATFSDLTSEFLVLPKGQGFLSFEDFQLAFDLLRKSTRDFDGITLQTFITALRADSRSLIVIRTILGMSPPEWAELARSEAGSDVTQGYARFLEKWARQDRDYFRQRLDNGLSPTEPKLSRRVQSLLRVAAARITAGADRVPDDMVHRLDKFDTESGIDSLRYASSEHVPYPVLLYERYLGRPFASHRDAVSEIVGEVMENSVESILREHRILYRKTKRAERIPGFGQAPDFCIPNEVSPSVVIEAKITSDDGTARDKVARIKVLAAQRDEHILAGKKPYQVLACIDGRGFRERREDMRQLLVALKGKVFTTRTLEQMIEHTNLRDFVSE